jgi:hypothetical protein
MKTKCNKTIQSDDHTADRYALTVLGSKQPDYKFEISAQDAASAHRWRARMRDLTARAVLAGLHLKGFGVAASALGLQ